MSRLTTRATCRFAQGLEELELPPYPPPPSLKRDLEQTLGGLERDVKVSERTSAEPACTVHADQSCAPFRRSIVASWMALTSVLRRRDFPPRSARASVLVSRPPDRSAASADPRTVTEVSEAVLVVTPPMIPLSYQSSRRSKSLLINSARSSRSKLSTSSLALNPPYTPFPLRRHLTSSHAPSAPSCPLFTFLIIRLHTISPPTHCVPSATTPIGVHSAGEEQRDQVLEEVQRIEGEEEEEEEAGGEEQLPSEQVAMAMAVEAAAGEETEGSSLTTPVTVLLQAASSSSGGDDDDEGAADLVALAAAVVVVAACVDVGVVLILMGAADEEGALDAGAEEEEAEAEGALGEEATPRPSLMASYTPVVNPCVSKTMIPPSPFSMAYSCESCARCQICARRQRERAGTDLQPSA